MRRKYSIFTKTRSCAFVCVCTCLCVCVWPLTRPCANPTQLQSPLEGLSYRQQRKGSRERRRREGGGSWTEHSFPCHTVLAKALYTAADVRLLCYCSIFLGLSVRVSVRQVSGRKGLESWLCASEWQMCAACVLMQLFWKQKETGRRCMHNRHNFFSNITQMHKLKRSHPMKNSLSKYS